MPTKQEKFSLLLSLPFIPTLFLGVPDSYCYAHTSYCFARSFKVIIAVNLQQHKTSYEPVPQHLVSDHDTFVQPPLKPVTPTTVVRHNVVWFLVWFWLPGFLFLCSSPEVPPAAIDHRFSYRTWTQTSHLGLRHRDNLNKILDNWQESKRRCLSIKLNQQQAGKALLIYMMSKSVECSPHEPHKGNFWEGKLFIKGCQREKKKKVLSVSFHGILAVK